MSFENFGKRRDVSSLVEKMKSKGPETKSEFYYPILDKEKNTASVIIRFLPEKNTDLPYVTVFSHRFKGDDGKWVFVDLCPTTLGKECKVCSLNTDLWKTEQDVKKKIASIRKRQKAHIFNILIVKDSEQPDLEGTVQPFRCGSTIFDMIISAMKPEFDGIDPIDPFDIMEGCDFNLRIRRDATKDNQITYDKCDFTKKSSAVAGGDKEKLRVIYDSMIDLNKYISESLLPNESDLSAKLVKAYGECLAGTASITNTAPTEAPKQTRAATPSATEKMDPFPETGSVDTNTDDDLEFFRQIANS